MKIAGFQKLTLIDYPGKIACTLFLYGCNFKCSFCHNPELVLKPEGKEYSEEEILEFLKKRKSQLNGVCISGGEPLLSLGLDFLKQIRGIGYSIKIDTNGSFPEKLKELIDKRLVDFVAIDIKSSKEKYKEITNSDIDINKIEECMKLVSRLQDYEFRTTIIEGIHDIKEMKKIAIWLNEIIEKKPKKFCLQGFKNRGKLLDESFIGRKDTSEKFLNELGEKIEDYFEKIEVRF